MTELDDLFIKIKGEIVTTRKIKRSELKEVAEIMGLDVKWYYPAWYIIRMITSKVMFDNDPKLGMLIKRMNKENRRMKFGLAVNIATILLITYSALTKGISQWHFLVYFVSVSYAHYHANKIK